MLVLLVGLYHVGATPALAYIWEIKVMLNGLILSLVLKLSSCLAVVNSAIGAILPRRTAEPISGISCHNLVCRPILKTLVRWLTLTNVA